MTTEFKQGDGAALFESRLTAKRRMRGVGFDPITIITILSALLPLILECFRPTPASMRRRDGFRTKRRIALNIRRESPQTTWEEAYSQADDALEVIDEMTDDELQMVIDTELTDRQLMKGTPMSEPMFAAGPPENIEAMGNHFEGLALIASQPGAAEALANVRKAYGGRLPLVQMFRALAPFIISLIKGEDIDLMKLIEAILSLIPEQPVAA